MGDDFFHQGAFRLSYGFEYAGAMELSKNLSVPLPIGRWDTYDWYLELGPLSNVDAKYFHGKVPTWEAFVAHPTYDAVWQSRGRASRTGCTSKASSRRQKRICTTRARNSGARSTSGRR